MPKKPKVLLWMSTYINRLFLCQAIFIETLIGNLLGILHISWCAEAKTSRRSTRTETCIQLLYERHSVHLPARTQPQQNRTVVTICKAIRNASNVLRRRRTRGCSFVERELPYPADSTLFCPGCLRKIVTKRGLCVGAPDENGISAPLQGNGLRIGLYRNAERPPGRRNKSVCFTVHIGTGAASRSPL